MLDQNSGVRRGTRTSGERGRGDERTRTRDEDEWSSNFVTRTERERVVLKVLGTRTGQGRVILGRSTEACLHFQSYLNGHKNILNIFLISVLNPPIAFSGAAN